MNHNLPIELGKFWGSERDDRICELCRLDKLGDEYHYLFECSYFEEQRRMLLQKGLPRQPNMVIFNEVMNSKDKFALFKVSKKAQVGKDQEKAQSEKDSHSKNRGGKKPN